MAIDTPIKTEQDPKLAKEEATDNSRKSQCHIFLHGHMQDVKGWSQLTVALFKVFGL